MTSLPPPGPHGGDGPAVATALGWAPGDVLDLSQSLNPVCPDPVPVLSRYLDAVGRYPDPAPAAAALALAMEVDEDRLLLTNGGSEAIALVAGALGGHVEEPEFSLHPRGVGPRWRSNPHNPSGRLAGPEERAEVWDEAFYPLATGHWTRRDSDAVVVGSLTKLFACPGLRAGYVVAEPELVARLRAAQPMWSVNGLAAAAVPALLSLCDLPGWAAEIATRRRALEQVLRAHGLVPQPSDANWVLTEAPGLRYRLARHGVVVRDCTSFGLHDTARIAVPDAGGLERLEQALGADHDERPTTATTTERAPT